MLKWIRELLLGHFVFGLYALYNLTGLIDLIFLFNQMIYTEMIRGKYRITFFYKAFLYTDCGYNPFMC